ncbi:MAG: RNB domain-containing ribonuclease, partial [Rhodospirillales bacterium]|nr:RNB domain-containing ribonuclease [Rhodospirillales bacterium]
MPRDRKPFSPNKKSDLKTRLVHFLGRQSAGADRREIMRGLKLGPGSQKALDLALTNAEAASQIRKAKGGRYAVSKNLPPVTVIEVTGVNEDGEPMARPVGRDAEGPGPKITVREKGRRGPALGTGDRALAKLRPAPGDGDNAYDAEIIRRLTDGPKTVLGIYDGDQKIQSTDRRDRSDFTVEAKETGGAKAGELVVAEVGTRRRAGMLEARIIERLGVEPGPHAYSQISIHTHGLPTSFGEEALAEAESAGAASLGDRTDLRDIALVTIDGKDARDFDDAVWADADAENEGGWHLIVAIADVTWYVRPYSALDTEARLRGNSTYFPDRVVPMLPEALSNGWCSLKPDEDRSCLAAHLWINKHGKLIRHRFERALMRSVARLTYEQVQAYRDGNSTPPAGISARLNALYGAYEAFSRARDARGALDLEIPEQLVELDESGNVSRIGPTLRLDSHKLIEEFMIAANVAAAETLEKCRRPLLYRIHDQPPPDKLDAFRQFVSSLGLTMAKGQVLRPSDFNRLIEQAQAIDYGHLVDQAVLRSQAKAEYSPSNLGHFGLGLRNYCHFTS